MRLASLLLAGCFAATQGAQMTRQEVLTFGTRHYRPPASEVYKAALGALRALGYEIASEAPDRGIIVTGRKVVNAAPGGYGQVIVHARQFMVRLYTDDQARDVVVSAVPKVFEGDFDISEKPVWNLDGEREIWRQLFAQMDLVVSPSAPR
jgi:hypothetical protein